MVDDTTTTNVNVIVIGNGPAGLSASAFLAGWRPYYDPTKAHPNRRIHEQLMSHVGVSLFDQDLSWYDGEMFKLLDELVRPDADIGHMHPSSIKWKFESNKAVDHLVLGKTPAGGSWHEFSPQLLAVSSNSWFDLPAVPMTEWLGGKPLIDRLPMDVVRRYFEAYPKLAAIDKYQRPGTTVNKLQQTPDGWQVQYVDSHHKTFTFRAEKVILATGKSEQKRINVPGENHRNVVDTLPAMQKLLDLDTSVNHVLATFMEAYKMVRTDSVPKFALEELVDHNGTVDGAQQQIDGDGATHRTVCIVGGSLSAADAVLSALSENIRVVHVFRKHPKQIKNTLLGRLSASRYLDYRSIVALMTGRDECSLYDPRPMHHVTNIDLDHQSVTIAQIDDHTKTETITAECVAVFVGAKVSMPFFAGIGSVLHESEQKLVFDPSSNQCWSSTSMEHVPGLYAVGPLVGDNFVRYIVGGSMRATMSVVKGTQ